MKLVKKGEAADIPAEDSFGEYTPVLVEPLPGHSDEEVLFTLVEVGATDVDHLAPGFISAMLNSNILPEIREIAYIHHKPVKQLLLP